MSVVDQLKALESAIADAKSKKLKLDELTKQVIIAGDEYTKAVSKVQVIHKELQASVSELGFTLGNPTGVIEAPKEG